MAPPAAEALSEVAHVASSSRQRPSGTRLLHAHVQAVLTMSSVAFTARQAWGHAYIVSGAACTSLCPAAKMCVARKQ